MVADSCISQNEWTRRGRRCNTTFRLKPRSRHTPSTVAERLREPLVVLGGCALWTAAAGWVAAIAVAASSPAAGALVVTKGRAVKQVASDGRYVVWETGPLEGDGETRLLVRGLGHGRARVLLGAVNPGYGLALASGWIVYAQTGNSPQLRAMRIAGSGKTVLSRTIVAPFAARGRLVAWLEQHGHRQRVVVHDMSNGRTRVAFSLPSCQHERCYQLGQVTLAADGVAFTRDSTNPDFSWVYRIRFSNHLVTRAAVPHDPQPDLVPSSAGAVYFAFGRGWYRYDFGERPRRTAFRANPRAPIIGFEAGRWLLTSRRGCDSAIVSLAEGGHSRVVVSAARLRQLVPGKARLCVVLEGVSWDGPRPVTAWALVPPGSSEEHSDRGLYGVAFAAKALS
jgi:hypothetical protein